MTNEEMQATAGEKFVELSQVRKEIACLGARIEPFAEGFRALGAQLSRDPEGITGMADGREFEFRWEGDPAQQRHIRPPRTRFKFDPAQLVQWLGELQEATARRESIEKCLRQMGHAHMIES